MHNSDYYREQADHYRQLAASADDPAAKQEFLNWQQRVNRLPIRWMTVEQVGKSGASVTHNVCFSNRPVWVKRLQTIHHSSFDVTSAAGRRPLQDATQDAAERATNVRFGSKADMCSAKRHVRLAPESGHVQCN